MDSVKFSLRDLITYFLVGFIGFIYFAYRKGNPDEIFIKNAGNLKDNQTFLVIFLFAICYVLGHIIQGIDLGRLLISRKIKPILNKNKFFRFRQIIYYYFLYGRVSHLLYFANKNQNEFWKKVAYVQTKGQYQHSEYQYALKDFFNGMETVCFIITLDQLFLGKFAYFLPGILITILFCIKGKYSSENFIKNIEDTYSVLINNSINEING